MQILVRVSILSPAVEVTRKSWCEPRERIETVRASGFEVTGEKVWITAKGYVVGQLV